MGKLKTVSKVLQIKDKIKEELAIEIKKLKDQIDHEQSKLNSLEKSFTETVEKLRERQKGRATSVHELGLFYDYVGKLMEKMKAKKAMLNEWFQELHDKQDSLSEVYKEKRLFEIWQGKMVKEIAREKSLSEQKEMDYLFLSKWIRK